MERFAIKIDKKLKANLYKICRLCGIDNPDMVPIISDNPEDNENTCIDVEAELEMQQKINVLLGLSITKDDRMPQTMCCLCVDKINDFYEFREMCYATNAQTRKLLGLKNTKKPALDIKPKVEIKEESIVPTPIPIHAPAPAPASALNKNNKKRKSEEVVLKDEKPDINPIQPKKKLRFTTPAESNIKEEAALQIKKKLRFSGTIEEPPQQTPISSKKLKNNAVEDTKLKKEPSPPVAALVIPPVVSNKKLRLAAPPQKEIAFKKSKQKAGKNIEAEVKEEIMEEVKEEPSVMTAQFAKLPPAKLVPPLKLKFGCNICKERFPAKANLEMHRATHIPKVERYICTACNEVLSKSFDIKNHQLWHKLSKTPYVCGCCGESILNTYGFSRHLREHAFETPPALLVLDRECPLCHISYATNFLYNIHVCAVKTRRCAGCNRLQRNDAEYLKHSAQCAKVYLNYSKHIMPSVEALEDAVRIKNENDVEAAAEEMARISGVTLDMAPVVQLTRLSSPLIMAASHAVSATGLDETANTSNKKSGKKGVSKRDLRRVDELLKSTLDALVSIKHEPEVHVDQETPCVADQSDNEDDHETDDRDGGLDDFHHNNDSDSEDGEVGNNANITNTIKSAIEEGIEQVKIKQEIAEINEENSNKICGGLKLKIKKEHGQLNSSIIEQQKSSDKRAEKRKKKKKHKEKEKEKQKLPKDSQNEQYININNNSGEENIGNSAIRIKVEPQDGSDFGEKTVAAVLQQRPQPEATIMTSIPMMQFQIACVSSGVEFNNGANPVIDSNQTLASANHEAEPEDVKPNRQELDRIMKISHVTGGIAMETNEPEQNVSKELDNIGSYEKRSGGEDEGDHHVAGNEDDQYANENESDHDEDNQSENLDEEQNQLANEERSVEDIEYNKKTTMGKKIKSLLHPKTKVTVKLKENRLSNAPKSRNKACKSTARPPHTPVLQISAVQSGVTLDATTPTSSEITAVFIKPEPQNRGYSDEQPTITSPTSHHQLEEEEEIEDSANVHTEEEQNYISTIDFNNIMIKQEEDIEINDVQITEKTVKTIAKLNGIKRKRKHVKDKNLEQNDERLGNNDTFVEDDAEDEEETDSEEMEEDEEEAEEEEDDEEDEEMDLENEHEEREYRELEYPPELADEKCDHETEEDDRTSNENNKDLLNKEDSVRDISKENEDKVSFVIANVCSQVSTNDYTDSLRKIREEGATNQETVECKDTDIVTLSNVSTTSDVEIKHSSERNLFPETLKSSSGDKVDTTTPSDEGYIFNINDAESRLNTEVPNVFGVQTSIEDKININESQTKNTLTSVSQPLQTKQQSLQLQYTAQTTKESLGELLNPESQTEQIVDHILQDIQAIGPQESGKPDKEKEDEEYLLPPALDMPQESEKSDKDDENLLPSTSDVHDGNDQSNLQYTVKYSEQIKSTAISSLENLPCIQNSEVHFHHQMLPSPIPAEFGESPVRTTAFDNGNSKIGACLQTNTETCEISKDNQEDVDISTIEGIVQHPKDVNLEARPVTENLNNESGHNDENEDDYSEDEEETEQAPTEDESALVNNLEKCQNDLNEDNYNEDEVETEEVGIETESKLGNNLEERQNNANQEVLSQIRPTALALHPYLEDISSSSNSLLSNSLSQTPTPPLLQLAASARGVHNNFNSQRLLDTEETDNILNESNEVAETLAMSVSHPITQPILGQQLPPQMPTFNFDNINEIAENNNNANIEREQLQDEQQHLQEN